ncbi:unnamed protein product [Ceratitis capitata]|uniref:(Mediterranean fruit fly) hypothetical protein n=1 Tax=Ceratitis capitata TaxID=7213 RepID=A0A811UH31_CERCA|nr:unnamed protein product [Ceratitis capitata]
MKICNKHNNNRIKITRNKRTCLGCARRRTLAVVSSSEPPSEVHRHQLIECKAMLRRTEEGKASVCQHARNCVTAGGYAVSAAAC